MRLFISKAGFKIRTKADAEKFLNAGTDPDFGRVEEEIYWSDDTKDYCLYPVMKEVGFRSQRERGNIFAPYIIVDNPVDVIWKTRKWLNWQLFFYD